MVTMFWFGLCCVGESSSGRSPPRAWMPQAAKSIQSKLPSTSHVRGHQLIVHRGISVSLKTSSLHPCRQSTTGTSFRYLLSTRWKSAPHKHLHGWLHGPSLGYHHQRVNMVGKKSGRALLREEGMCGAQHVFLKLPSETGCFSQCSFSTQERHRACIC